MEDILRMIELALERRGISARAASIRAQGAPELIRDMRRGHVPSVVRLRALCEVLGLEFYVGPPRWRRAEDDALPDVPLRALERASQDLVQLTADAGGNPIPEDLWPVLVARRASELPGAEEDPFAEVRTLDAAPRIEPGADAPEASTEEERGPVWISRGWLAAHGADPATCTVLRNRDTSMAPTLPNGCAVLVDTSRTGWKPPDLMAVRLGADLVFRRAATGGDGRHIMACDHDDWPDEPLPDGAPIVGQVRWLGHWLD